jgi:hypothetical protein
VSRPSAFVAQYLVPKDGHSPEQCEDAFAVLPVVVPAEQVNEPIVAVVCDGASESLLARDWAGLLAGHVAQRVHGRRGRLRSVRDAASAIGSAIRAWDTHLADYLARREIEGKPVAWYEQPGLERGAYATVLAVCVEPYETGWRWRAAALGDTCLFHVRKGSEARAFPLTHALEFDTSPALANSRNTDIDLMVRNIAFAGGDCVMGDALFLATDALAAWFLREAEGGGQPWMDLRGFADKTLEDFAQFVDNLRTSGAMRNDDVALVHIDIG